MSKQERERLDDLLITTRSGAYDLIIWLRWRAALEEKKLLV